MKGDKDRVLECTTSAYDGLIAMVKPEDSWVARYQRVGRQLCITVDRHALSERPQTSSPLVSMPSTYRVSYQSMSSMISKPLEYTTGHATRLIEQGGTSTTRVSSICCCTQTLPSQGQARKGPHRPFETSIVHH